MRVRSLALLLGFVVGINTSALGNQLSSEAVGGLGQEFLWTHQVLEGGWTEKQTWDGWLCDGYYQYKLKFKGILTKLDLDLTEQGFMVATADLTDLFAGADGSYKSKATLCIPTGGWLGVGVDWAKLKTEVHFGDGADLKTVKLKILSTELGHLEFGKLFPTWFEDFFTGVVNRGLSAVWNSRLGDWLSDKITKIARDKIPTK